MDDFYVQHKTNKDGELYKYYPPTCKSCVIESSKEWIKNNEPAFRKSLKKYDKKEEVREKKKLYSRRHRASGEYKNWQTKNSDKLKGYRLKREAHKTHNIPEEEWIRCKMYFDYACAYCGLTEEEHRKVYKQQLHKEHVIHSGRNDIKNCVPSCKPCNGSKHTATLNEWYNSMNLSYSYERYMKIYQWIRFDCKNPKK